jgi:tetratricopeptide (TPR) repeat protein
MRVLGRFALLLSLLAGLGGCAGVDVDAPASPAGKLRYAIELFDRQDMPVPAERLIREAIDIYQEIKDQIGLAEAYRTYGFFFGSRSILKWSNHYLEHGFLDKSASLDFNLLKSIEYFEKAGAIFAAHRRFDKLVNVNLNIGFTYARLGNRAAACRAFETSLANNRDDLRANPDAKLILPKGFESFEAYVADLKKQNGCT